MGRFEDVLHDLGHIMLLDTDDIDSIQQYVTLAATIPAEVRDEAKCLEIVRKVSAMPYHDDSRLLQILGATYFCLGRFEESANAIQGAIEQRLSTEFAAR